MNGHVALSLTCDIFLLFGNSELGLDYQIMVGPLISRVFSFKCNTRPWFLLGAALLDRIPSDGDDDHSTLSCTKRRLLRNAKGVDSARNMQGFPLGEPISSLQNWNVVKNFETYFPNLIPKCEN